MIFSFFCIVTLLSSFNLINFSIWAIVVSFNLNKNDTEDFIQSLVHKISAHLIEEQDENEGILEENSPIKPTGELDFEKIVGEVFQVRHSTRRINHLKMRRIEL